MNKEPKRGRGRPRKPTDDLLNCHVRIFLKQADKTALQDTADREGVSLSELLRQLVLEKIEQQ